MVSLGVTCTSIGNQLRKLEDKLEQVRAQALISEIVKAKGAKQVDVKLSGRDLLRQLIADPFEFLLQLEASTSSDLNIAPVQQAHAVTAMVTQCSVDVQKCDVQPEAATLLPGGVNLEKPDMTADSILMRQAALGLDDANVQTFIDASEFISLGSYCAVARTLQTLGLKKFTYPFDWARTPVKGVVQCLDTHFEDFFKFESTSSHGALKVFESTSWGGSFWHHDPEVPRTQSDFARRINRLFGLAEVAADMSRVYVRVANSSQEVQDTLLLWDALKRATPTSHVYLLVIVDMQAQAVPMRIAGSAFDGLLFHTIHESLYTEILPGYPNTDGLKKLQVCSDWYSEAVAFAVRLWSGDANATAGVQVVPDALDLCNSLQQWDGGNTAYSLFNPMKVADCGLQNDARPNRVM